MKFKVGDKIKIVRGTAGCYGAEWKIGFESKCELLDELTAEEAIKIQAEMCRSMSSCSVCPIYKEKGDYRCDSFRMANSENVVEIIKQWKADHKKKPIETEIVYLIRVMKEEGDYETCIYAYEIDANREKIDEKMDELVKQYYKENGGKIYANCERLCRAKS